MAKVYVIKGIRCTPETNKLSEKAIAEVIANAKARSAEKAELTLTILNAKTADILATL